MAENNIDEFNLLRSILCSDDHLQIRPSGDFNQIYLKLDYDICISFLYDSLNSSTKSLTINNVNDLHISKLTHKNSLTNEQWINIRDYFNKLVQQSNSNTSLYSIIQLIQEYILQISNKNVKPNEKISISTSRLKEDASTQIGKFRGADLIFNRIAYDTTIDRSQVLIGYEDRFTGIHEIKFNDFKKVHEDDYGIPMHRIRYYKLNGSIVWDRNKKFDILTGSEIYNETTIYIKQELNLVEGMYRYDQSIQQWILCPHISLASDNLKNPSIDNMFIPERCQFLTWNILFDYYQSEFIYTNQRYEEILKTLKSFLPDIICLQEVTIKFLNLLLDETWLKENNYYIIIMGTILDNKQKQSYGQLMLMKNFRPRAFSICPLDISEDVTSTIKKRTKKYISARFALNSDVTIDLVNLHLHSNHTFNANEKRCQLLEYFFKTMNTQNYMLIGDFNFGDYDIKEQNILQRHQHQIHDLWKDIYDLDENSGYTFDPSRNICAQITSDFQLSLRLDRYLLHKLHNLSYSIEHLNIVGLETISIDPINNKHINQSDHYALQLIINFRIRPITHRSALVLLPPMNIWPLIESFREKYDPLFNQWPPHINLFWPFFDLIDTEDDEENILLPLRLLFAQYKSFDIEINEIDSIKENHISFMKLNQQSTEHVKQLYENIKQLFPQWLFNNENNYNLHMTIAQFDSMKKQNQVKPLLTLTEPIQFPVRYVYILRQTSDDHKTSFHIAYQLPLGSVMEPIGLNPYSNISFELQEFFNKMSLYEDKKSYEQKQEKFNRLSICFEEIFNKNTLHYFTYAFFPYGSFRLGLNGEDLDTVFILSEQKSTNNNNKTNLDQIFLQLRYDSLALNQHIINLLTTQINNDLNNEIIDCRNIQAVYPIISILFHDQTRVEIFVQINEKSILNEQYQDETYLLSNFHEPIHGVHDTERLITYVRSPPMFQHLLIFIRTWAQNVGLYGQVYGYLCGYSWAILCACICHRFLPLNSFHFSIEEFFILVEKFFSTYSHFNWSSESVCLYSKNYYSDQSSIDNRGSMHILCPSPPYINTSRSTIDSTCYLIIQGFQKVHKIIEKKLKYEDTLKEILQLSNHFPDKAIQSILQLTLSGKTISELYQWIGYMKSRLAHFLNGCQVECNLFVQTQNNIEIRKQNLERFYSIGFQLNEQILSRHRQFYYCLNTFLEQFTICSFRSETMKISYKLMSIHDWNRERIKT
ncbi:unnamed protein product [Rotaria sordida]|uniref:polynucleotide adenylyltransferase n=1 Tax=Rotaria sordida TaxID=392033 RepID=A0A818HLK8_9BILA|nr:unnamed protein product [Rotaria sordida]